MIYTHLTQDKRYQIALLAKAGRDQSAVAKLMDRDKSTISRELRRNRGLRGYRPKQAHQIALERTQACKNGRQGAQATWTVVHAKLIETWSPEQISGYLFINE